MPLPNPLTTRPRLFVASTAEGNEIAKILEARLGVVAEVTSWREALSAPSSPEFDGLMDVPSEFDFAVFVLHDEREDDVLLQLGVFLGALGRERIAVVCPASGALDLPSDVTGAILATYPLPRDGDVRAALGPACATIEDHIRRLTARVGVADAAAQPARDPKSQVARRLRRSLGTACSVRPGGVLRIADISLTGALLETFGEIPEDQVLDLELALDHGPQVRVTAKVVRIQYPQWGRVGGVGVRFIQFEGESRSILEHFLETEPARQAATASPPGFPTPAA